MLYLDCNNNRLFTELVQTIESRNLSWVRPLALEILQPLNGLDPSTQAGYPPCVLVDLRGGSDLLMPTQLFQLVIDVDLIPILAELNTLKQNAQGDRHVHDYLQRFVHQVCQRYPHVF